LCAEDKELIVHFYINRASNLREHSASLKAKFEKSTYQNNEYFEIMHIAAVWDEEGQDAPIQEPAATGGL
jgi:hypothetical protein